MPLYIIGIIAILVGTGFHAGANILDNYFSGKIFRRLSNLIFFSALGNLLFLPFIFFIEKPDTISLYSFGLILLIAVINILYQIPYYKALQKTDTSIVSSLFSLGKVFTPLLASIMVKEHLNYIQYIGFFIIILSNVLLTFDFKNFRFNESFILMLFVSIILVIQAILFKFLYEKGVTWGTSVIWTTIIVFVISFSFIFFPKNYRDIKTSVNKIKKFGWLFMLNQFLNWGGEVIGLYALYLIPVSIYEGISSAQPIFVLLISLLIIGNKPRLLNEFTDKKNMWKKIVFFSFMVIGTLMVI
jgi:drug/metabolite transporter (DMT)-like permease